MKKAIALTTCTLVAGVALYFKGSLEATINHLMLKYPQCNRKIAKKVYRDIMINIATGTLGVDIDDYTEEQMDELFLARYNEYISR